MASNSFSTAPRHLTLNRFFCEKYWRNWAFISYSDIIHRMFRGLCFTLWYDTPKTQIRKKLKSRGFFLFKKALLSLSVTHSIKTQNKRNRRFGRIYEEIEDCGQSVPVKRIADLGTPKGWLVQWTGTFVNEFGPAWKWSSSPCRKNQWKDTTLGRPDLTSRCESSSSSSGACTHSGHHHQK